MMGVGNETRHNRAWKAPLSCAQSVRHYPETWRLYVHVYQLEFVLPFHCECCFRFAKEHRDDKALDFKRKESRRPLNGLDGLHAAKTGSKYGALHTSLEGAMLAPVFIQ